MKYVLIILILIMSSCSKSFLEKVPEDALTSNTFFNSVESIKSGLMSCYKDLQSIYNQTDLPLVVELMSDDGKDRFGTGNWHTFKKNNGDSQKGIWDNNYKMIFNCNKILEEIDTYEAKGPEEEDVLKNFEGEAKFLRGLAYFNLVRLYGPVPKVMEVFDDPNDAIGIGRSGIDEIYRDIILPDFKFASENCLKKSELGSELARASKGAGLTMLAKAYLTLKEFGLAEDALEELIVNKAGGEYSLFPDYGKLFRPENKFNQESIFEVNFNVSAGQPSFWFRWAANDVGLIHGVSTSTNLLVEHNLMREFDNNDEHIRYPTTVDSGFIPQSTIPIQAMVIKHTPPVNELAPFNNTGTDYNYVITRYADALLMYAEVLFLNGKTDNAVQYINEVRRRVDQPEISEEEVNMDEILHERRMELAFEGHRYFDLVRTDKAIEVITDDLMTPLDFDNNIEISGPIPEYQLILPIPEEEIEKDNSLSQNSGY